MATLIFDWSAFLTLAKTLGTASDEASQRTSISRAYYCAYHKARERAVLTGYIDEKSHYKLWDVYNRNSRDHVCRKLSDLGARMHKERKAADYDPVVNRLSDRVIAQLNRANQFLSQLSAIGSGLPRP